MSGISEQLLVSRIINRLVLEDITAQRGEPNSTYVVDYGREAVAIFRFALATKMIFCGTAPAASYQDVAATGEEIAAMIVAFRLAGSKP